MNLRVSTVLGLGGGGGLGQAIYNNVQLGFYTRLTTLVAIVYALVLITDRLSDRLRFRPPAPARGAAGHSATVRTAARQTAAKACEPLRDAASFRAGGRHRPALSEPQEGGAIDETRGEK